MNLGLRLSLLIVPLAAGCDTAGEPAASRSQSRSSRAAIVADGNASAAATKVQEAEEGEPTSVAAEPRGAPGPHATDDQPRNGDGPTEEAAAKSGDEPPPADRRAPTDGTDAIPEASTPVAEPDAASSDGAPRTHDYSTFDLLTPTTVAPLVLRLRIAIDGKPLEGVFAHELTELRARLDADDDGQLRWEELVTDSLIADILTGGQPEQRMMMQRGAAGRYDLNRNQIVESDELQRVLASGSAQYGPFDLEARFNYRHSNRTESNILRIVDADRDGRLNDGEIRAAGRALQTYDLNADGVLRADELAPPESSAMGRMARRTGAAFGEAALVLNDASDWSLIGDALRWWPGVKEGPFGDFATGLDSNGDGWFYPDEARGIQQRQPHLTATIDFSPSGASDQWRSEVVVQPTESLCTEAAQCEHEGGRFVVQTPRLRWILEVPDGALVATQDRQEPLRKGQVQVQAGEQPDVFFAILDADSDGGLSGREVRAAAARLRQLDGNADRVVDPAEVPDCYVVSLRWRGAEPVAAPGGTEVFEDIPRWARFLDLNRDGEIERSEFPGTDAQFQQLDTDGDGYATLAEAARIAAAKDARGDAVAE